MTDRKQIVSNQETINTAFVFYKYQKKGRTKEYYYDSKLIHKLELHEEYYIKVVDIYDADTITCILFYRDIPTIIKIRLQGIDTPEMKPPKDKPNRDVEKAKAKEAKEVVEKLILNKYIKLNVSGLDKYGRYLVSVNCPDTNKSKRIDQSTNKFSNFKIG